MASYVRTAVCTACLLFASTVLVFASSPPLRLVINPGSDQVVAVRYMTGTKENGTWNDVDITSSVVLLEHFDNDRDLLFVQQKAAGQEWSPSHIYRYDTLTDRWQQVVIRTLSVTSMDVRPYALWPVGSSSTLYSIVTGAAVKLNISYDKEHSPYGYCEAGYSRGPALSDWAESMQAINVSAGMGFRFPLGKHVAVAPEVGYGLVLHLLYGDLDQDGTQSNETFLDQQVRLSLNLSIAPAESYELLIAPFGVLFFEKDRVGALYGVQAGMRFNF